MAYPNNKNYNNNNGGDKKAAKDTIFKKSIWDQNDIKKRKFMSIERFNNNVMVGVKHWDPEVNKFDFKYFASASFNYDDFMPVFIKILKEIVRSVKGISKDKDAQPKATVYSTTISAFNGSALSIAVKLDENKEPFMVLGMTSKEVEGKERTKDFFTLAKTDRLTVEVKQNECNVETPIFGETAIEDMMKRVDKYHYDPMKQSEFLRKLLGDNSGNGKAGEGASFLDEETEDPVF